MQEGCWRVRAGEGQHSGSDAGAVLRRWAAGVWGLVHPLSPLRAMLFGAIISATDPVRGWGGRGGGGRGGMGWRHHRVQPVRAMNHLVTAACCCGMGLVCCCGHESALTVVVTAAAALGRQPYPVEYCDCTRSLGGCLCRPVVMGWL